MRDLFNRWVALAKACGPAMVYAQKTRIVIQTRVRFAGAMPRRHWLDCGLWLTRRVEHPCLRRVERFGPDSFGHYFRLTEPGHLDAALARLMREAYAVGRQEHLSARSPRKPLPRVHAKRPGR